MHHISRRIFWEKVDHTKTTSSWVSELCWYGWQLKNFQMLTSTLVRNLNDTNKKQNYNLMFKKPKSTSVYNYLSGLYFVQPQSRLENLESWKHE